MTVAIEIWASRAGVDPRDHFWFKDGDTLKRLCDGVEWSAPAAAGKGLGFRVPCRLCTALAVDDAVYGLGQLHLRVGFPATEGGRHRNEGGRHCNEGGRHRNEGGIPYHGEIRTGETTMPAVSMTLFTQFCNAKVKGQLRMVADQQRIAADRKLAAGRDYYGPVRASIIRGHIKTEDLSTFEDTLQAVIGQPRRDPAKKPTVSAFRRGIQGLLAQRGCCPLSW